MELLVVVKLSAPNDNNGNPRRLFIVKKIDSENPHFSGERVEIIDEGYRGNAAYRESYPGAIFIGEYEISASTYRHWMQVKRNDEKLRSGRS